MRHHPLILEAADTCGVRPEVPRARGRAPCGQLRSTARRSSDHVLCALLLLLCAGRAFAQAPARMTEEGTDEVLWLDRLCLADSWHPVEECRTRASGLQCPWGGEVLQLYFRVDHHGGEKAYPIGWPRAHMNPAGWERNWKAWDHFEFMVLAKTSRDELPKQALVLEVGEAKPVHTPSLEFSELEKWVPVSIPVADILQKSPSTRGGVNRLRFVVCESSYQHDDVVEFHIGGFRLVRSLVCEVTALSAATPVIYSDQPYITLDLTVVGPPADVKRGVPFTIRTATRVVRQEMLPLGRGQQRIECDIYELMLSPGDYELSVFDTDRARRKSVSLRVVEEPWKQQ